jgi:hypothetical protein
MNDEIVRGSCVAHDGKVVNPRVASALEALMPVPSNLEPSTSNPRISNLAL